MGRPMGGLLARLALAVVPALIALVCVIVASGYLISALYLYLLALPEPPALAALFVALALLFLAVLVIVAARIVGAIWRWRASRGIADGGESGLGAIASRLGARAAHEAQSAAEAHPYYTFCAAFLAGLTLGGSPHMRNFVEMALRASERRSGRHS
jgi:hypothetical protein